MRKAIGILPIDRQCAITTYAVKSNYFRFETLTLNFMRKELLHNVGNSNTYHRIYHVR